jgi:hypothetical protein
MKSAQVNEPYLGGEMPGSGSHPTRGAMIYMLVLVLCLAARVITCAIHGDPPWGPHPWEFLWL